MCRPDTRWRVASTCSIRCGVVRRLAHSRASTANAADHVNQRVLQPNCRRAAVEFGALLKVRRPVQHDSWQGPQIASRPHSDMHDRRRRIGQRRRVSQRGRPERQHRSPLPLRLCEPAAVVHIDTPVNVDQFATAPQSGDVVIGAGGGQYLAT